MNGHHTVRMTIGAVIGSFELNVPNFGVVFVDSSGLQNVDETSSGPDGRADGPAFPVQSGHGSVTKSLFHQQPSEAESHGLGSQPSCRLMTTLLKACQRLNNRERQVERFVMALRFLNWA